MKRRRHPERVLVLGGTGLLGSAIAREYLTSGSEVVVVARRPPDGDLETGLAGAEFVAGLADDQELLTRALKGVDRVVHALGCPFPAESNRDPAGDLAVTVPLVVRLLERLRDMPGVALTFISSGGTIYGDSGQQIVSEDMPTRPITAYGVTKLTAEKFIHMYAELYGLRTTILRVGNAYGPRQSPHRGQGVIAAFLDAALNGRSVPIFGDGSLVRDYVHVDDVARAAVALSRMDAAPITVNVGTGKGHTILEVLRLVELATGATIPVDWLPARPFDVKHVVLDVSRLSSLIPWHPVELGAGVGDMLAQWSARPAALMA